MFEQTSQNLKLHTRNAFAIWPYICAFSVLLAKLPFWSSCRQRHSFGVTPYEMCVLDGRESPFAAVLGGIHSRGSGHVALTLSQSDRVMRYPRSTRSMWLRNRICCTAKRSAGSAGDITRSFTSVLGCTRKQKPFWQACDWEIFVTCRTTPCLRG